MQTLKTLIPALAILVASSLFNVSAQTREIKTAGQAMSLCKAQAEKAHPGYERSKSTQIKQSRGMFKIKLKVNTANDTVITFCEVTKDGQVTYGKE